MSSERDRNGIIFSRVSFSIHVASSTASDNATLPALCIFAIISAGAPTLMSSRARIEYVLIFVLYILEISRFSKRRNLTLMYKRAFEAHQRKDYKTAKSILKSICQPNKHFRAWTLLSLIYLEEKAYEEAYEASREGVKPDKFVLADFVKTMAMFKMNMDREKCLKQLTRTLKLDKECLYTIKMASCVASEHERAEMLYESAQKLGSGERSIKMTYRAAQMYSKSSKKSDALRCFKEVARRCEEEGVLKELGVVSSYKVNALSGINGADRAPESYVKKLYDSFASTFDVTLVKKLEYKTPTKIATLLSTLNERFETACDLGCGTGLSGIKLKKFVKKTLVGVDLSDSMIELARKRDGIYDNLIVCDIIEYLQRSTFSFDLVVSCDVFVYLGDLETVFRGVFSKLSKNGVFAFSTEQQITCGEKESACSCSSSFKLDTTMRFKHCTEYILHLSREVGFSVLGCIRGRAIRKNGGSNVLGDIFLLRKS